MEEVRCECGNLVCEDDRPECCGRCPGCCYCEFEGMSEEEVMEIHVDQVANMRCGNVY